MFFFSITPINKYFTLYKRFVLFFKKRDINRPYAVQQFVDHICVVANGDRTYVTKQQDDCLNC